jgi:AAA+ ATPase superfamily predicted ATPase
MNFLDRKQELERINYLRSRKESMLLVLYGRRRIGKTSLLRQIKKEDDIHFIADQSETPLQIEAFARITGKHIAGFDTAIYPDWESCLLTLNERLSKKITIIIDEFPYLVKNAPELPSILQKLFDNRSELSFHLFLCGSSQQMMQNLVVDSTSPLYGRANEIIKLLPMNIYWLKEALNCSWTEAVEEYCVWGGIPRYWDLRMQETSMKEAVIKHILDSNGVLYEEPVRLFLDDSRDTVQMSTLIAIISSGVHRLSEIASRIGKPATHLNRPLQRLIDLGYLKREIPYGTSPRKAKRTLYKVADPFINFYFRYVVPDKTSLELGLAEMIYDKVVVPGFTEYCSGFWEDICRNSIPLLFRDKLFSPGSRWWSGSRPDYQTEIDIVSSSKDGSEMIVAEVKWAESVNIASLCNDLDRKTVAVHGAKDKTIRKALFLKNMPDYIPEGYSIFTAEEVILSYQ